MKDVGFKHLLNNFCTLKLDPIYPEKYNLVLTEEKLDQQTDPEELEEQLKSLPQAQKISIIS